ncbi:hypothetical protein EJ05DRAFT_498167 [Pseudovirgaria hyperparasitica]|uniref:Uncharacterized protein n=1 Tax=Pseudovirgaria hyperparasitica TaxID=470096 RepID=A0A6A6WDY9_9PEZI|nr:uncharacterized protein EJ05DRAFT_498167 [Pseudovirgaria hyperparasitica]KAF2760200.1 hypothetical protein EJ05DRAFT_498167 [Pseudovirgaria hyperparasitica]
MNEQESSAATLNANEQEVEQWLSDFSFELNAKILRNLTPSVLRWVLEFMTTPTAPPESTAPVAGWSRPRKHLISASELLRDPDIVTLIARFSTFSEALTAIEDSHLVFQALRDHRNHAAGLLCFLQPRQFNFDLGRLTVQQYLHLAKQHGEPVPAADIYINPLLMQLMQRMRQLPFFSDVDTVALQKFANRPAGRWKFMFCTNPPCQKIQLLIPLRRAWPPNVSSRTSTDVGPPGKYFLRTQQRSLEFFCLANDQDYILEELTILDGHFTLERLQKDVQRIFSNCVALDVHSTELAKILFCEFAPYALNQDPVARPDLETYVLVNTDNTIRLAMDDDALLVYRIREMVWRDWVGERRVVRYQRPRHTLT